MEMLLEVSGLAKSYGARRAVDGVSFRLRAGQTLDLIGPNGAGKSTTVGMLCGLLRPDAGEVRLGGVAVGPGVNAAKRRIGLVPQDLALYEDLPAQDNLMLFGALYGIGRSEARVRAARVLEQVNLLDRARERPATFSGGMKRRLNIAAALMHAPDLLILDEPTVGVDPQSRNAIFDILEALKAKGCALVYTSHYMEEVERLADHIVVIDGGKVLADDTPAGLQRRLPSQAALHVELIDPPEAALLAGLRALSGVTGVHIDGAHLEIGLAHESDALPVMGWLDRSSCRTQGFATARTRLEDIFLHLTGRSLRD
ncbi:ABC transporter ATP-binding protein [Massilia sp. Dwa41.01b]|uniref:ABC transporter ATP-binding protein n=1 Tax=Massilia sp. Dwa41.01b TaxID=2709302 RepID=UPI0016009D8A|nr:ABC transporter ATP-binding protein [Massilia sp. Dwa41.01b]QNA87856.1 ABC transporter ATP-binding protein [Massilia sp. Dwa41.01b]